MIRYATSRLEAIILYGCRFPIEIAAKSFVGRPIEETRALTNQPEYIFNADLTYDNPDWGLRVSLISYHISEVLQGVSFADSYDVYGNAYKSLDLTASKTKFEGKLFN